MREFGLENLLAGHRDRIARAVFGDLVQDLSNEYRKLFEGNRRYLEMFQAVGFSLPPELRSAAEFTLSRQFEAEIRSQRESRDPEAYAKAIEIVQEAERLGYHLDTDPANQRLFGEMITDAVNGAMANPDSSNLQTAIEAMH